MTKDEIRAAAEADLETFIRLVHPNRVLGSIHSEIISWLTREDRKSHQIVIIPRDHQKSALAGYYTAWEITRNPAIRVLYISSTSTLAVKQLKFIKDILTSRIYRRYWPEMVNEQEARREKWTETEISVDHPKRQDENIREPTVFTAGLTTNITGLHCDLSVLDDVVTDETAYTKEAREKLETNYSYLASIEGTDGRSVVVGTRYDPRDLYNTLLEMKMDIWDGDEEGEPEYVFEMFGAGDPTKIQVEDRGDGRGVFLWPRQQRGDGRWFGFDEKILRKKKSQYVNKTQFFAQYYNNPNAQENAAIKPEYFQYFDRSLLKREAGYWYYKGIRLNVFAGIDFAFTLNKNSDYSAIVVVGVDSSQNYFVLDIDRFQTQSIKEYFERILRLHQKWDFRKLRAEITGAQEVIVKTLKTDYIRFHGLALSVEDFRPNRLAGTKEERIQNILQPRYENRQVWHFRGGNCQLLEEELVLTRPAHDDIKDCLATVIDTCIAPSYRRISSVDRSGTTAVETHARFGGVL